VRSSRVFDGDRITREYHNHGQLLEPLTRQHLVSLTQLLAGASALLVTAASAAPLSPNASVVPESNIQNVRRVCSESGHCWRERGERRIIIREHHDSYGYAPRRERYIERGGYRGAASASARRVLASESAPIATGEIDQSLIQTKPRRNPRLLFACKLKQERVISLHRAGTPTCGAQLGRFSHVRGVCSPQPFHEPKGPDRNEREHEKCSAGQESRH
jgi:hypothetical protein